MNNKQLVVKGVIFDLNGTLIEDTQLHNNAWDIFLSDKNVRLSDEDKVNFMHGKSNREIFEFIFPGQLSNDEVFRMAEEKESIYRQLFLDSGIQLVNGAVDLFKYLKDKGIAFAIATSSSKVNVDFFIETLHLLDYFDSEHIIYNDGTIPGKPDPLIFQMAMKVLGLQAKEVLIFEDSPAGILGAQRSEAGSIVIVDTNENDFTHWNYPVIKDFTELDRSLFF
ncbi:MAG: HAD family hydrolase [Bacteroidales bacterium]